MLDDLRRSTQVTDDPGFDFDNDPVILSDARETSDRRFLGMTAAERMMLSIFLFMNVSIIMVALLLATGRLSF